MLNSLDKKTQQHLALIEVNVDTGGGGGKMFKYFYIFDKNVAQCVLFFVHRICSG